MDLSPNQQLFNKSYLGLKAQGFERSVLPFRNRTCVYRGPRGLKCAIGHCIPDEEYSPSLEGYGASNICVLEILDRHFPGHHVGLPALLQSIHDLANSPQGMDEGLRRVANQFGLEVPA